MCVWNKSDKTVRASKVWGDYGFNMQRSPQKITWWLKDTMESMFGWTWDGEDQRKRE